LRVILIGPRGVGKTTVAKILTESLRLKYVSLDEEEKNLDISIRQTPEGRFETVKSVFEKYQNDACVFDFGSFHSFYIEEHLFNEIYKLLHPEENVFLLLPSVNIEESEQLLFEMNAQQIPEPLLSMVSRSNSNIVQSPQNEQLAKHTVFTKDLNFEQIAEIIISRIK
jgi:AAA+ ATPase superfamily predicted ATPase